MFYMFICVFYELDSFAYNLSGPEGMGARVGGRLGALGAWGTLGGWIEWENTIQLVTDLSLSQDVGR